VESKSDIRYSMCILFVESQNSGETFQQSAQIIYRGGAQGQGCIAAVWHKYTHASRQSLVE